MLVQGAVGLPTQTITYPDDYIPDNYPPGHMHIPLNLKADNYPPENSFDKQFLNVL